MARRYRVIQYDGPEPWIIGVFARSLIGGLRVGDRTITVWEAAEGDKVEPRELHRLAPENFRDERFSELDVDANAKPVPANIGQSLGHSVCAFYQNANGVCALCQVSFIAGHGKPTTCVVNSVAVPPVGDKPR